MVGVGKHSLNGAATPAMAASAPGKPFCLNCKTTILYHDSDDAITCQSCGKPWTVPPPTPPTAEDIRAEVLQELTELAQPVADKFWHKYVALQDVAKLLRIGWQAMAQHRKRMEIPATRLTWPDGQRGLMIEVEDAKRLIADITSLD